MVKPVQIDRAAEREQIELQLLLEAIFRFYGYDFQDYAVDYVQAVVRQSMALEKVRTIPRLQEKILRSTLAMQRFLMALSQPSPVSPRYPHFLEAFADQIVPLLKTYPSVRIWLAGCSSPKSIYDIAMLLAQSGIYSKCQIYATDPDDAVVQIAADGLFPANALPAYTATAHSAPGARDSFLDFCHLGSRDAIYDSSIKRNIVFAQHDLVSDSSFNHFQVIVCRHLLSKYNPGLQARVHRTFYESLELFGILALGPGESVDPSPMSTCFVDFDGPNKLFRKVR